MKKIILALLLTPFIAFAAPLNATQGGTGTVIKPTLGQVLIGQAWGAYAPVSTSTLFYGAINVSSINATSTAATSTFSGGFTVGSSSLAFVVDRGSSKVGTGTSTPAARLSVAGAAGSTVPLLLISSSTAGFATGTVAMVDNNGLTVWGTATTTGLFLNYVSANATPVMIKMGVQNSGIGIPSGDTTGLSIVFAGSEYYRLRSSEFRIVNAMVWGTSIDHLGDSFLYRSAANTMKLGSSASLSDGTFITGTGSFGSTTPAAKLSIAGSAGGTTPLFMISTSTGAFATRTAMTVHSSGSVGVNVRVPTYDMLQVDNTFGINFDSTTWPAIRGEFIHGGNSGGKLSIGGLQIIAQGANQSTLGSGAIRFITPTSDSAGNATDASLAVRMSILQNGNIGIGTTSPTTNFVVSNQPAGTGAVATTTVDFGDFATTTSRACFNTKNLAGSAISFYFSGTSMVVEANRCR